MKGLFGRLADFWTSQPLFRKIYIYGIFFIGSFAVLGEFGEYLAGDILQREGGEFSSK